MSSQTLQLMNLATKSGREPNVAMIEITIPDVFVDKAQRCSEMLRDLGMHVAIEDSALKTSLYRRSEQGGFEPCDDGWPSCCNVLVFPDGSIELEMNSVGEDSSLVCDLGKIRDLQQHFQGPDTGCSKTPRMGM